MVLSFGLRSTFIITILSTFGQNVVLGQATQIAEPTTEFRSYAYEVKPDDEAFRKFNPR